MKVYFLLIVTQLALDARAQMINNGASIAMSERTVVGVNADFLNTGKITNKGDFFLKRNWLNVGVYDSAGGQLIFNGTQPQEIINNGQKIDKLTLENGIKDLTDDLIITNELNLNQAVLAVNEEVRLTFGQGVLITGANYHAYINGTLHRIGTGDLFFPIGTDTEYLPVTLSEVIGTNPTIALTAFSGSPSQQTGGDLDELVGDRYWVMQNDENYTASFISLPFNVQSSFDTTNLVVAQATSEQGKFSTLGKSAIQYAASDGTVTSQGNAIGPYFATARAPETKPLPPLKVVNALTPLQDGKHDFLRIENIELYPDNLVEVFDRHGNKVFSIKNYDNRERVFRGDPNVGLYGSLPDGNYFYTIKTGKLKVTSGFLFLKK